MRHLFLYYDLLYHYHYTSPVIWFLIRIEIYTGLMIESNLEIEHIYHLYVVKNFDARRRITDLSNDTFEARKHTNLYSVSQTITIIFITILPSSRLKLKEQNIQLEFRMIRESLNDKILPSQARFQMFMFDLILITTYYMETLIGYIQTRTNIDPCYIQGV